MCHNKVEGVTSKAILGKVDAKKMDAGEEEMIKKIDDQVKYSRVNPDVLKYNDYEKLTECLSKVNVLKLDTHKLGETEICNLNFGMELGGYPVLLMFENNGTRKVKAYLVK